MAEAVKSVVGRRLERVRLSRHEPFLRVHSCALLAYRWQKEGATWSTAASRMPMPLTIKGTVCLPLGEPALYTIAKMVGKTQNHRVGCRQGA